MLPLLCEERQCAEDTTVELFESKSRSRVFAAEPLGRFGATQGLARVA